MVLSILRLIYFLFPVYAADMTPYFMRRMLSSLDYPLDFGLTFKGRMLLGPHKTFRGMITGILAGIAIFNLQKALDFSSIIIYSDNSAFLGFLLSSGVIFGDAVKSFFKRQLDIPPGHDFHIADQVDGVLGAIFFSSLLIDYTWMQIFLMVSLTFALKTLAFDFAVRLHIREN